MLNRRNIAGLIVFLMVLLTACSPQVAPTHLPPEGGGVATVQDGETKPPSVNPEPSPASPSPPAPPEETPGEKAAEPPAEDEPEKLTVRFFDVGQGDSALVQGPGFTLLIDAGRHDRTDVVPHLKAAGVESIDLLVGTHQHADHIGQMDKVLQSFPVGSVWLNGAEHTTSVFERVLDAILATDAEYHEPRAGETFSSGKMQMQVLSPKRLSGDANNDSIAIRLQYGDVSFLFAGDAEAEAERQMVASGLELQADILKVGHHGSRTSSTEPFLRAVKPKVAIYSAGVDNQYGHPHQEFINRIYPTGASLYGTDTHGTVTVVTDGLTYTVTTEKDPSVVPQPKEDPVKVSEGSGPAQVGHEVAAAAADPSAGLQILSVSSSVKAGERAEVAAQTEPWATCSIVVRYKSGPSKAQGLEDKVAGADGVFRWTWSVGAKTTSGTWPITVRCGSESVETEFEVH